MNQEKVYFNSQIILTFYRLFYLIVFSIVDIEIFQILGNKKILLSMMYFVAEVVEYFLLTVLVCIQI